jgi:hypothetical protein
VYPRFTGHPRVIFVGRCSPTKIKTTLHISHTNLFCFLPSRYNNNLFLDRESASCQRVLLIDTLKVQSSPIIIIMTPGSYQHHHNNNNNKAIEPLRDLLGDVLLRLEALESKVGIASTGGGSSSTTTTTTTTTPSSLSTGESFFFGPQCIIIFGCIDIRFFVIPLFLHTIFLSRSLFCWSFWNIQLFIYIYNQITTQPPKSRSNPILQYT